MAVAADEARRVGQPLTPSMQEPARSIAFSAPVGRPRPGDAVTHA